MTEAKVSRSVLVRFGALVPTFAAGVLFLQALSLGRVSTTLPAKWGWTSDPWIVWPALAATATTTLVLTTLMPRIEGWVQRREDRSKLSLQNDYALQSNISVYKEPSARLRWTMQLQLAYWGSRVLVVQNISPECPELETEDGRRIQLVRTKTAEQYRSYSSFGALAHAQGNPDDPRDIDRHTEDWPLLLPPGSRVHIAVEHEFELRIDDEPMEFSDPESLLPYLGPYFLLNELSEGEFQIGEIEIPFRLRCADDEWGVEVGVAIMLAGATVLLPSEEDMDADADSIGFRP